MDDLPTGTVTLLFTDIEGSTRLWEEQSGAMRIALARHDALLRAAIQTHGGHVFKTIGDGFCAVFAAAPDAVRAAVEAKKVLGAEVPALRVRMAVHTGEAELREGDYFGPALNRVARLLAAGYGDQVLLSEAAAKRVAPSLPEGSHLRSLGEHRLRDLVREPIFQLLAPGLRGDFPPLNTLDVAFRRGLRRALAISGAVIVLFGLLALVAVNQARRANRERRVANQQRRLAEQNLYAAQMSLACQAVDGNDIGRAQALVEQWPKPGQEDLRGFEWRYLWRRCQGDQLFTFRGHTRSVQCISISPDGKILASGSADGTVKLWDLTSQREVATLGGHKAGVNAVAFSPDGTMLASGSSDSTVKPWDVGSWRKAGAPKAWNWSPSSLRGHKGSVRSVVFSPTGKSVASAGDDRTIRLWDVASRRGYARHGWIARYPAPAQGGVACLAFSPDGKTLASGGEGDIDLRLWSVTRMREVGVFRDAGQVSGMAFSPDGRTLATASWDGMVRIWDIATRRETTTLKGHLGTANSVAFSPDGRTVASGSGDSTVKLWVIATKQEVATLIGHNGAVSSVMFSSDGKTLVTASADKTIRLWDTHPKSDTVILRKRGWVDDVAYSPDGKMVASTGDDVKLWDTTRGRVVATLPHPRVVYSVAFSPDGKLLASGDDNTVRLWDITPTLRTGTRRRELATFSGHKDWVNSVRFSPDGKLLAWGENRTVKLWDVTPSLRAGTRRQEPTTLRGHRDTVMCVAFSPDGRTLASASNDKTVRLWDVLSRREVGPPLNGGGGNERGGGVRSVAFSPDGKILASGTWNGHVTLWDVATRSGATHFDQGPGEMLAVLFSPDGKRLVTTHANGKIRIWNPATQQEVATLTGHTGSVRAVAFSPDGNTLASAANDGTVRLWQAASFEQVVSPAGRPQQR